MQLEINTSDFTYQLPEDRIAKYPLLERDQSKLLAYRNGNIEHHKFSDIAKLLPKNSTLFFNNTKVIAARLLFRKSTGAQIEVFLLSPADSKVPVHIGLQANTSCIWKCTIGNLKKWREETTIELPDDKLSLRAKLLNAEEGLVEFSWSEELTFGEVIDKVGNTPLPPYLNRDPEEGDRERYQTVYSAHEGAVAAPTAGLHFSESILNQIQSKGVHFEFLTLHVSAGTFQPIKTSNAFEHPMHAEQIVITKQNVEKLLNGPQSVVAVGTTSMRTLESTYWYGVSLLKRAEKGFIIEQKDPYRYKKVNLPCKEEALKAVMAQFGDSEQLFGKTSIYIVPGYEFKVCDGLITNFHQPGSTLMLLVASFIGSKWKEIYDSALTNNYRFLSYGDSSLLLP